MGQTWRPERPGLRRPARRELGGALWDKGMGWETVWG